MAFTLSNSQVQSFNDEGFVIVRNFLNTEESSRLLEVALNDDVVNKNSYDLDDQTGKKTRLALWYVPGEDIYGLLTKSERMVLSADKLLAGNAPVCHYHSKLMQKEPRVGGAWEWHQDYGYWYLNDFLFPDQMVSVMIAITRATKENGCLQIIKGSHHMGRVEHGTAGEQVGASQRHVDLALKTMELQYVELEPGDALFFHSNLLHRSEANLSDQSRWSLISCYNRQSNVPYNEKSTSSTVPLEIVADDAMMTCAKGGLSESVSFFTKENSL